ncbi:MAG TPA: cytochrome C [Lutibacter sp.]|nr:cytochrome C [Lutibacter sp.]
MKKSNWFIRVFVGIMLVALGATDAMAQQTLDDVKKARGLNDTDVLAAVKTFMPRGGRDEYFSIVGTGNSGTMIVYGIPSMRIYKYVGVFTPEPWQGYGFDDESSLMLKKSSLDDRISTYGDMRFPAFSEKGGNYDGHFAFFSDGANSRIALLGLDDFETKQVLSNPLYLSTYPGVAVTQNTEYIIQSSQYPAPWDNKLTSDMKSGVTFWKFVEGENIHKSRMIKEKSFTLELPPYTLDFFDAGKSSSDGLLVGLADKDGKNYVYVIDYNKLAKAPSKKVNDFNVVSFDEAKKNNAVGFIEIPTTGKMLRVAPNGKSFLVPAGNNVIVFDFAKVKSALAKGTVIALADVQKSSIAIGKDVIDVAFDQRKNTAYASAHGDSKIVRFNYESGKTEKEVKLSFKPSFLMTPQGNSASPHSNYLTVVDKEGLYENYPNVGPIRPSFQHLIDISSDDMTDVYTMTLPQANVYGSVAVLRTTIKPIIRYPLGTNTRAGEISRYKTVAGQEKIEREGNRVHVFGTLIRSHITPEIVTVNEGDVVTFHLTNLERAEDETHGFTVDTYGVHGSFEPGKTASVTFTANRPGVFPYYCTEFCSALHLEMEGILLVRPTGYVDIEQEDVVLTKEQMAGFKKNYEDKLVVIDQTQDVINSVVTFLKENNFGDYPYVAALVTDAFDQLDQAKSSKEKHEKYAKEGKYKQAFLWAEQYWQYQVKTADVGLRAKKLLEERINK